MWPIPTDVARSVVYMSVCLCVGHTDMLCKNRWGLTRVGPRNNVLDGSRFFTERGNFWGLPIPLKTIGSMCCGVCSKRDHSVLNKGRTVRLLQPTAMLPTNRCDNIVSVKPFVKILWPLVMIFSVFTSRRYASAVCGICCRRVSVRPSVCPSQAGTVPKQINVGSCKQRQRL